MPTNNDTREGWLNRMAEAIARDLLGPQGYDLPPFRVTCGFPSKGARARTRRAIGQCYSPESSADNTTEVMVSPVIADPTEAAAVLAHELAHAAVGVQQGHGAAFTKAVRAIGLEGKPTATTPGDGFRSWVEDVYDGIGPYPHAALDPGADDKKQGTRMLAVVCDCDPDVYRVRMTRKQLDRGAPTCPLCGAPMHEA